jgi:hypothetical protein
MVTPQASAEQRLKELGIELPAPPEPFGTYVEAVQTGNLLFLTGMLPTEGREAKFVGRVGAELDVDAARKAARLAALNALAVARKHLGSLDKVSRIVAGLPALRIVFTLAAIFFLYVGVFIFRRRHQFFDRDPSVENDVPAVRHIRVEVILFIWSALALVLLSIVYQLWSA